MRLSCSAAVVGKSQKSSVSLQLLTRNLIPLNQTSGRTASQSYQHFHSHKSLSIGAPVRHCPTMSSNETHISLQLRPWLTQQRFWKIRVGPLFHVFFSILLKSCSAFRRFPSHGWPFQSIYIVLKQPMVHWIGLREVLQETSRFDGKKLGVLWIFPRQPIQWMTTWGSLRKPPGALLQLPLLELSLCVHPRLVKTAVRKISKKNHPQQQLVYINGVWNIWHPLWKMMEFVSWDDEIPNIYILYYIYIYGKS